MQLTTHTDYALRTLIILGLNAPDKLTIREISRAYGISENHLVKVVGRLTSLGYVSTTRGKDGGARLAQDPSTIDLGKVVRDVEPELGVVVCLREGASQPCVIGPACKLRSVLHEATEQFLATLSRYSLADVLADKPQALIRLLKLHEKPAEQAAGGGL